jgi:hypothetical protein
LPLSATNAQVTFILRASLRTRRSNSSPFTSVIVGHLCPSVKAQIGGATMRAGTGSWCSRRVARATAASKSRHGTAARAPARGTLSEPARVRFTGMLLDPGARLDVRDDLPRSTPLGGHAAGGSGKWWNCRSRAEPRWKSRMPSRGPLRWRA